MNETSMAARAVELVQSFKRTEKSLFINSILPPWHSCSRGRRITVSIRLLPNETVQFNNHN